MKNPHSAVFVVFLASLASLPPLSIDMGLPALNEISRDLHCSLGEAGLTLTLFMAGFAGGPLVYGPLSDRYGRRHVLLSGLGLFSAGGIAAMVAPTIGLLLAARLLEGAGAGAGISMAFAIVRDLFKGEDARVKLSYVQMVTALAPMLAPTIGAAIMSVAPWRAIYGVLGFGGLGLVLAVWLGFRESHAPEPSHGSIFGRVVNGYAVLFRRRVGLGFALLYGLSFGVQFSFISGSPLVFMGHFAVTAQIYGLIFAAASAGIMLGAFSNTRLSRAGIGGKLPIRLGFGIYLATSLTMLVLVLAGVASVADMLPPLVLSAYAYGLIGPNASHGTLQALPEIAGIAGAMLTSFQMVVAVAASATVAAVYASAGLFAMVLPMLGFGVAALAVYLGFVVMAGQRQTVS